MKTVLPGLLLALASTAANADPEAANAAAPVAVQQPPDVLEAASAEVKRVARWVVFSGDNRGLPFLLVDKVNAQALVFSPAGRLEGSAPVLLGMARGDRLLAPNSATMAVMKPEQRITPAGRFESRLAKDYEGAELLVLDYEAAISLHPVLTKKPEERRLERLQTATAEDNRISFGCINVPAEFYAKVVSPTFARTRGIVYVLPESESASEIFGLDPDAKTAGVSPHPGARSAP